MGYKVIHYFTDLQDFNHPYKVGDEYPRLGMKVSDARIAELLSSKNKQKKPLIAWEGEKEVSEPLTEEKKTYKKSDIFRMPVAELQELAKAEGIENAEEKTGAELKTLLVKHLNL